MPVCGSGCTHLGFGSSSSFSMKDLASLHIFFFQLSTTLECATESL